MSRLRNQLRKKHPAPPPGPCPVCENHTTTWILDHNHLTESFRGYICNSCNLGFGKFNDDPEILKRALLYLIDYTDATNPTVRF